MLIIYLILFKSIYEHGISHVLYSGIQSRSSSIKYPPFILVRCHILYFGPNWINWSKIILNKLHQQKKEIQSKITMKGVAFRTTGIPVRLGTNLHVLGYLIVFSFKFFRVRCRFWWYMLNYAFLIIIQSFIFS